MMEDGEGPRQVNGHSSLYLMMGQVHERVIHLVDKVDHLRASTDRQFLDGIHRMDRHEQLIREVKRELHQRSRRRWLERALKIMPLREWVAGILGGVLLLQGIISTADLKAWIFSTIGPQ